MRSPSADPEQALWAETILGSSLLCAELYRVEWSESSSKFPSFTLCLHTFHSNWLYAIKEPWASLWIHCQHWNVGHLWNYLPSWLLPHLWCLQTHKLLSIAEALTHTSRLVGQMRTAPHAWNSGKEEIKEQLKEEIKQSSEGQEDARVRHPFPLLTKSQAHNYWQAARHS